MIERASFSFPDQIGLPDQVLALRKILIAAKRDCFAIRSARQDVGIDLVVIRVLDRRVDMKIVRKVVVDATACDVNLGACFVETGYAEERLVISGQRSRAERGNAAIGDPTVVVIGIMRGKAGIGAEPCGNRRGDADEASFVEVAVVVELLVSAGHAQAEILRCVEIDVARQRKGRERIDRSIEIDEAGRDVRRLADAVDRAAAAPASEDEGVGTFQDFDPLDIVEGAEILRIVTQSVEIEVGRGFLTADENLVAMSFARFQGDARNVAQRVVQLAQALVFQLVFGQNGDALRNVEQGSFGLRSARPILAAIAFLLANDDDRRRQIVAILLCGICGIVACGERRRCGKCKRRDRDGEQAAIGDGLHSVTPLLRIVLVS